MLACVYYTRLPNLKLALLTGELTACNQSRPPLYCNDRSYVSLSGYGRTDLDEFEDAVEYYTELMEDTDSVMLALRPGVIPNSALVYRSHEDPLQGYRNLVDVPVTDVYTDAEILVKNRLPFAKEDVVALVYAPQFFKAVAELSGMGYRTLTFREFVDEMKRAQ